MTKINNEKTDFETNKTGLDQKDDTLNSGCFITTQYIDLFGW